MNREKDFIILLCVDVSQLHIFDGIDKEIKEISSVDFMVMKKHGRAHLPMPNNTIIKDIEHLVCMQSRADFVSSILSHCMHQIISDSEYHSQCFLCGVHSRYCSPSATDQTCTGN